MRHLRDALEQRIAAPDWEGASRLHLQIREWYQESGRDTKLVETYAQSLFALVEFGLESAQLSTDSIIISDLRTLHSEQPDGPVVADAMGMSQALLLGKNIDREDFEMAEALAAEARQLFEKHPENEVLKRVVAALAKVLGTPNEDVKP